MKKAEEEEEEDARTTRLDGIECMKDFEQQKTSEDVLAAPELLAGINLL